MKKLLIALVLASLFVLGVAVAVSADNGPHGSFTATTDACASCHRAHSAQYGSNSLLIANPEALCMSCHDGTGAGTNVHDGVYGGVVDMTTTPPTFTANASYTTEGTPGRPLFGGGFVNTLMATAWSGATTANPAFNAVSRPITSEHNLDVSGTVWGSGAATSANGSMVLECTSCHDPHGSAGRNVATTPYTKVASYRLLRWQPSGSAGFTPPAANVNWSGGAFPMSVTTCTVNPTTCPTGFTNSTTGWLVPDNFATLGQEWYTIGTTGAFAIGDYNAGNANNVYNTRNPAVAAGSYIPAAVNTSFFCAQCHDRYFTNSALRNNLEPSNYCGTIDALPVAFNVPVVAANATTGLHPTDPTRCVQSEYETPRASGTFYTVWGDNGGTADSTYKFMHSSGDIRASMDGAVAAGAGTSVSRACVACHVAHGTSAEMTAFASDATLAAVAGADVDNSLLLRMDNRSVCLRCHASDINFVVAP